MQGVRGRNICPRAGLPGLLSMRARDVFSAIEINHLCGLRAGDVLTCVCYSVLGVLGRFVCCPIWLSRVLAVQCRVVQPPVQGHVMHRLPGWDPHRLWLLSVHTLRGGYLLRHGRRDVGSGLHKVQQGQVLWCGRGRFGGKVPDVSRRVALPVRGADIARHCRLLVHLVHCISGGSFRHRVHAARLLSTPQKGQRGRERIVWGFCCPRGRQGRSWHGGERP
mmetsp:Transcript_868/g.1902  ORF Transcript_868/g.1902 Transcript_868/m.1902 type:complete len:221 (+) Transcript_868:634-1296(+)